MHFQFRHVQTDRQGKCGRDEMNEIEIGLMLSGGEEGGEVLLDFLLMQIVFCVLL